MKKYLVTHEASIRRGADEVQLPPIQLKFYTMLQAANEEALQDQLLQYKDPNFVSRVVSTAEVADMISSDELLELLEQTKVLTEQAP